MPSIQKRLGAFYSPEDHARVLVRWALNGAPGAVLDPSFGGCAFLRVAVDELKRVGAEHPSAYIWGTDVDTATAQWRSRLLDQGVPGGQLLDIDFLTSVPGEDLPLAKAVVGNPPYIRHQWTDSDAVSSTRAAINAGGVSLSARASLWAYFVVHAANHVVTNGRLALLLPGAVANADYASPLLEFLKNTFARVGFIRVQERIFAEAQEETIVLFAEKGPAPAKAIEIADVDTFAEVEEVLYSNVRGLLDAGRFARLGDAWKHAALPPAARALFTQLIESPSTTKLADVATVRIGVVTGANAFFLASDEEISELHLTHRVVPVVSRSAWLSSLVLDEQALERLGSRAKRHLLIVSEQDVDVSSDLKRRILGAEKARLHESSHCQKRSPWWMLQSPKPPDAFFRYMSGSFRGMVLNSASATSTNAIHQVTFRSPISPDRQKEIVLSSWSSLTSLSAEIHGRNYGGGVLKLEVHEANAVDIALTKTASFEGITGTGHPEQLADEYLQRSLDLSSADIKQLRDATAILASRRASSTTSSANDAERAS